MAPRAGFYSYHGMQNPKLLEAKAWMRKSLNMDEALPPSTDHAHWSRTHIFVRRSRAFPSASLSYWHAGRPAVPPEPRAPSSSSGRSQWDGRAGVAPARRVGQCLLLFGA